jgi:outer membrane murein-binding lipoprotein Lpp
MTIYDNVFTQQQDAQKIHQLTNENMKLQIEVDVLFSAKERLTSTNDKLYAKYGKLDIINKQLDNTVFNMKVATLATMAILMYEKQVSDAISAMLIAQLSDEKSAVIKDNKILTDKVNELSAQIDVLNDDKAVLSKEVVSVTASAQANITAAAKANEKAVQQAVSIAVNKWTVTALTFIMVVVCSALMYLWQAASAVTATPAAVLGDTGVGTHDGVAAAAAGNSGGGQVEQQQYGVHSADDDDAMDDGGVFDMIDGMLSETQQVMNGGYADWLADHPDETDDDATNLNADA